MHDELQLRPVDFEDPDDDAFLFALYRSTRDWEIPLLLQSGINVEALFRQQLTAQHAGYRQRYGDTIRFDLLLHPPHRIGRLYVAVDGPAHTLVDISLLPSHRGLGIGTFLIRRLQDQTRTAHGWLKLSVAWHNPALGLYRRLGFQPSAPADGSSPEEPFIHEMIWHPEGNPSG